MNVGRLAGRVALITGGLGGIGWAVAGRFVAEEARVVVADLPADDGGRVLTELGDAARYVALDVRDPDAWSAATHAAVDAFGRLDVLVNNAGVWRPGALADVTAADARLSFEVNQLGCLLGMQAVAGPMQISGGGAIVNVSSGAGMGGYPGQIAYGATKWAVRGMTKTAAIELGPLGIRVNSIHPGSIDTPMTAGVKRPDGNPFAFLPVPRRGTVDEVAALAVHLAAPESSYTTAAEVVIDGGLGAGPMMQGPRT